MTEQRELQEQSILDSLRDPLAILDPDLRVIAVNRPFCQFLEIERHEVAGRLLKEFLPRSLERLDLEALAAVAEESEAEGLEWESEEGLTSRGRRKLRLHARPVSRPFKPKGRILLTIEDITERRRAERQVQRLQAAAVESTANAIFITDARGSIEWVNPAFENLTGYTREEAVGANPRILKSDQQSEEFYEKLWKSILGGRAWTGRVINRHQDGTLYTVEQTITPMLDENGGITHFVAIHEDITARIEVENRMAHMARHDFLTDLLNRYAINDRLGLELSRSVRHGGLLSVLMLDLDRFKDVNDSFGHQVGDLLLVEVANRLRGTVRDADALARLGGDEFAIVQAALEDPRGAAELAKRAIDVLSEPFDIEDRRLFVSGSLGIAISAGGEETPDLLLRQADLALYRAKADGGNTYRFFAEEMGEEVEQRMAVVHDLRGALQRDELFLVYQPQVEIGERKIVGAEALLRWQHPERGLIEPVEFIPVAESSGLIVPIGEWVLSTACEQAKAWQDLGLAAGPMAVNLSVVQLRSPRFPETVMKALEESGLEPKYLELELTEGILAQGSGFVESALWQLSEAGVRISLDDFGRGYSSLEYLRRYPFNKLKIDRSFVHDMQFNKKNATIVRAVIALAEKLGLQVIAEGVEPEEDLELLVDGGCREVQGFYFSRPVSAADFESLLKTAGGRMEPQL